MVFPCLFSPPFTPASLLLFTLAPVFPSRWWFYFSSTFRHFCWFIFHSCLSSGFLDKRLFCSQLSSNSRQRFSGAIPLPGCFSRFYHSVAATCWLPFENSRLRKIHSPRKRWLCPRTWLLASSCRSDSKSHSRCRGSSSPTQSGHPMVLGAGWAPWMCPHSDDTSSVGACSDSHPRSSVPVFLHILLLVDHLPPLWLSYSIALSPICAYEVGFQEESKCWFYAAIFEPQTLLFIH